MVLDLKNFLRKGLPDPVNPFDGLPEFNFTGGHNSIQSFPLDDLLNSSNRVLTKYGKNLSFYYHTNGPQGDLALRNFLVQYLYSYNGMSFSDQNVIITSGSLQALDLIYNTFINAGDTVLVESSTYGGALKRLNNIGAKYHGIKLDKDGLSCDSLIEVLENLKKKNVKPKALYTIPTVQNPSGTIMSLKRRQQLLKLANKYDFLIIEDDCYADLTWNRNRPKAIFSMDTDKRVVYCGSFSKSIAPAFRVGYIVASWNIIRHILSLKNDGGTGALEQMVLADFCSNNFEKHLSYLVKDLKGKCDTMAYCLDAEFGSIADFVYPSGGIFIWVSFPDFINTSKLAEVCLSRGVSINPGSEWTSDPKQGKNKIRLCFANPSKNQIQEGVKKLAQICFEEFGEPQISHNKKRKL